MGNCSSKREPEIESSKRKTCRKWRVNVGGRSGVCRRGRRVKRKGKAKEGRDSFLQKWKERDRSGEGGEGEKNPSGAFRAQFLLMFLCFG